MKNIVYLVLVFIVLFSCSVKEKPIFIKVDNLKLISYKRDTIILKADAFFQNPNDVGGKISTDEIKVIINDSEVAQVSSDEFEVPARNQFTIPLKVAIPAKRVFENNKNGILGGLLNSLLNKSIKVQFKGDLKYKVFGYSSTYLIDNTQDVKIKF
ncbi:LEA type 2 family protein [Polaribacter porphyrae]|uniref:Late embryogenesis abundant protein LEA-2 subgroup domain-containing protein n=1 Tax=Polaribacter porphyrae TaxID=1137780 RepID=A0A2S7WMX0_9FLAO|nr:LEA type 2 family protein [Polaribacter porphyrae]PQJ78796.1 hypothetical protein BTO18_06180 [Polaribacter porphyrae]